MNIKDRAAKYKQYLKTDDQDEAMRLLKEAFDVTQDDIDKDIEDIVNNIDNDPIFISSYRYNILMHDLRDMRDSSVINRSRKQVLSNAFITDTDEDSEEEDITQLFPVL